MLKHARRGPWAAPFALGRGMGGTPRAGYTRAMIDFETLKRPNTPNTYLVAPDGLCREAVLDRIAPVYAVAPDSLDAAWTALMSRQPRTRLEARDAALRISEYTQRTRLLRFTDRITVQFLAAGRPDHATLAVYSRSQVGYSDLGTNRKRIEAWLEALGAELPSVS